MVEWTENIDKAIVGYDPQSIVLVAPPDADLIRKKVNENLLEESPTYCISFLTTLVASTNDSCISIEKAQSYAQNWGSEFIDIGNAEHINEPSGYGEWEQGYEIFKKLG